jgi:hypothetical protein
MKTCNRRLLDRTAWFMLALSIYALPCAAHHKALTSPECGLKTTMDAIPQEFQLNNLRSVGATLSVDGAQPRSIADNDGCTTVIAKGSGQHKFVVESADGKHAQGSFDLDAAARADASDANALHNEICTLDDSGLECHIVRGYSPPNK